jgi:hypothetical protein
VSRTAALCAAAALAGAVLASAATAADGSYTIAGGTPRERAQVHAALQASAFDWSLLPPLSVRIVRGGSSSAAPGDVVLDADLLDTGRFSWGVVLHEFAHELDFLVLDDAGRAELTALLGGAAWWGRAGLAHDDATCERFATMLAWASWPVADNVMGPTSDIPPRAFLAAVERLVAQ